MTTRRTRQSIIAITLMGVTTYLAACHRGDSSDSLTASGTVEATEAALGFQVPGRVESLRVHEGDAVKRGDTLAALDRADLLARLAQVEGQLAAARALLAEMQHGPRPEELAQAREADSVAAARLRDAERDFTRTQELVRVAAVSQQSMDKAREALDVARNQKHQADQQLRLVKEGPRPERVTAQRAVVAQAEAAVNQAKAALNNAIIVAPFGGVITVRHHEPGETVGAGAPVLTLSNLADRWVRVYIPENRISAVRLSGPATIKTDTYPGRAYHGAVSFIASQAEFTPRNVQTPEERVKLVYAVKVRVTDDSSNALKPGMPADVSISLK